MGKIFISYAREDSEKADSIRNGLKSLSFDVWMDTHNMRANDDITTAIDSKIKDVDVVLVLWSEASRQSVWVRGEALRGLENDKYFGILLDTQSPPVPFNSFNAPNLTEWTGLHSHAGWDNVVRKMAEMTVPPSAGIIGNLDSFQKEEKAKADAAAAVQEALPLELQEAPIAENPAERYSDVDALISAARTLLSSGSKGELDAVITQAALDQEMLRDAQYVVGPNFGEPAPAPSKRNVIASLDEALKTAVDGDLIVVLPGEYKTNAQVRKMVRIVGVGSAHMRPTLVAKTRAPVIAFETSARLENINVETRQSTVAVNCGVGTQPVILRCNIRRFSKGDTSVGDAALHVAGASRPTVMSSSITATGCEGIRFVLSATGDFLGVNVLASRGAAVMCRGRPTFEGCTLEAVGGHVVEVLGAGQPNFENCEISGRGMSVIHVAEWARPKIRATKVKAIRQLAFDFEGDASGIFESNIVQVDTSQEAGTIREEKPRWFGVFGGQKKPVSRSSEIAAKIMRMKSRKKPVFISNTLSTGEELPLPPM